MFEQLLQVAQTYGLPGLLIALVVLVGVFLAKRGGLVVTGNQARIANITLAAIIAGLDPANPEAEKAIIAAIAAIASALIYQGATYIGELKAKG